MFHGDDGHSAQPACCADAEKPLFHEASSSNAYIVTCADCRVALPGYSTDGPTGRSLHVLTYMCRVLICEACLHDRFYIVSFFFNFYLYFLFISAHDTAETAQLRIYLSHEGNCSILAARHFEYYYDTAHHLAWFLIDSVHDPHALEDLELVRSECFDLANEILSTLDDRLCQAFEHLTLPEDWNLLGDDANENGETTLEIYMYQR